ncbi:MAG: hypothetical protein LQ341_006173, partial [Variospora aurantia]
RFERYEMCLCNGETLRIEEIRGGLHSYVHIVFTNSDAPVSISASSCLLLVAAVNPSYSSLAATRGAWRLNGSISA